MNAPLSVRAAAREAPERLALIAGEARLTFAELAAAIEAPLAGLPERGAATFVAERTLETAVLVYALLERGLTAVPLHPKLDFQTHEELRARVARAPLATAPAHAGPAAVLFTSGSQGRAKGVQLSAAALVASAAASAHNLGWRDDDRWLCCLPLAHAGGLSILVRCLVARRCAVLMEERPFDAGAFEAALHRHRVTLTSLVPTMLEDAVVRPPPPALRAVLLGGAAAPADLVERAVGAGWPILLTYGMTETASQVCTQPAGTRARPGDVGPVLAPTEVRIRAGRILVRGPTLTSGYLDDPSPLDADGWLDTGDLGGLDERGHLHVRGRADDTIISGGENVHPSEVEERLRRLPGIAAAVVFPVADPRWGQLVAAALVLTADAPGDPWVRVQRELAALPSHLRPRRICRVDRLPLGPTGKPDRRAAARELAPRLRPVEG